MSDSKAKEMVNKEEKFEVFRKRYEEIFGLVGEIMRRVVHTVPSCFERHQAIREIKSCAKWIDKCQQKEWKVNHGG